jgi:hypothetical protein
MQAGFSSVVMLKALKDSIVLGINRENMRPRRLGAIHQERTGHNQRFLVGQQQFFARSSSCQGRTQACSANNRCHHTIDMF